MARWPSGRSVKIHRAYTIAEAAARLGAQKHTVRRWIAAGLPATGAKRSLLIHGADLRAFLKALGPKKQPCQPGEFYCLKCRTPKRPALDMADYIPKSKSRGLLRGICLTCERLIHRAASPRTIAQKFGGLVIAFPKAERRIDDISSPLSNVDFKQDRQT
jgi:excisionase family DNA binding protein